MTLARGPQGYLLLGPAARIPFL